MKIKSLLILILAAGLIYFVYLSAYRGSSLLGSSAPDFTLPSKTGSLSLHDLRGQWILLNFWASWCPPCVKEMPSLEALHLKMQGRSLKVLAVSVDEGGWGAVDPFLARIPMTATILLDEGGKTASRYGVFQLPQTYLIDPQGRVVEEYIGPRDWMSRAIVSEIEKYVQESR